MSKKKKYTLREMDARLTKGIQRARAWKRRGLGTVITATTLGAVVGGAGFLLGHRHRGFCWGLWVRHAVRAL